MFSPIDILLIFLIILFLLLWLTLGVFFFIALISGISLRIRTRIKYPEIPVSFFIFIHKKHWVRMINYPKRFDLFFSMLRSFGARKDTENWINNSMDLKSLRALKDKKIDKYLNRLITGLSWFVKLFFLGAIDIILVFIIGITSGRLVPV